MNELVLTLKKLLRDITLFTRYASGLKLRAYQEEVARAIVDSVVRRKGLSIVVVFPRQSGKNELQAQLETYLLCCYYLMNAEMVKVSPTWKPQTLNAMRRLERVLGGNLIAKHLWTKESGYIYRCGKARIYFFTGQPRSNIVGATANVLLEVVQAVANVDLAAADVPTGAENTYYIFANRTDGSTSFTLSVSTSITEGANQRRIGRFFWDGAKIEKDSLRTELSVSLKSLLYYVEPQICEGRLTLSTGVSVSTTDITSSATLFFTPHRGNRVALYVPNYGWRLYTFAELSLDISAVAADTNLDIWLYDNAGVLTLAYTAWSNDTLRATAIVRQDGIYCKSGALNYRYLGTIRTSGTGVTCDTKLKRFVWNYYNRVNRSFYITEATESWTYNARTWRPWNNSVNNRLAFVIGVNEELIRLQFHAANTCTTDITRAVGIGLDSVSLPSTDCVWNSQSISGNQSSQAHYTGYPGIGFHYLQLLELGYSTVITYYGTLTTSGTEMHHSGAVGNLMG